MPNYISVDKALARITLSKVSRESIWPSAFKANHSAAYKSTVERLNRLHCVYGISKQLHTEQELCREHWSLQPREACGRWLWGRSMLSTLQWRKWWLLTISYTLAFVPLLMSFKYYDTSWMSKFTVQWYYCWPASDYSQQRWMNSTTSWFSAHLILRISKEPTVRAFWGFRQ